MSYVKVDEGPKPMIHSSTITSTGFIPMGDDVETPMSWMYCPLCGNTELKVCDCELLNFFCGNDDCDWRHINHRHCKGRVATTAGGATTGSTGAIPTDLNTKAITSGAIRNSYYASTVPGSRA